VGDGVGDGSAVDPLEAWNQALPAADEVQIGEWGRALGRGVPLPVIVTLDGPLGAGKTTLVRAIAEGAGVIDLDAVTSPTFALVHEYTAARGAIAHLDLYRLDGPSDVERLGFDSILDRHAMVLIEWPDRLGSLILDRPRLAITIDYRSSAVDDRHRDVSSRVVQP
jgi:tRNA threonylcarbamoyladenosine biosynthesis protein TsaE